MEAKNQDVTELIAEHGTIKHEDLIDSLEEQTNENIELLNKKLAKAVNDGDIVRIYDNGLLYRISSADENMGGGEISGLEVVNKNVNPFEHVRWDAYEFHDVDGKYDKVVAKIQSSIDGNGASPRISLSGETGTGKTAAVDSISKQFEIPVFRVQGRYAINESHLLGRSVLVNDTTKFMYGPVTQAVRMSNERPVILHIDELTRIRSDGRSVIMSLQRNDVTVTLDQRGGEKIIGDPENLIVITTKNEGGDYEVNDTDIAQRRRYTEIEFEWLGLHRPEKEQEIIVERTPVGENLAEAMVKIANEIRTGVNNNLFRHVNMGVPTSVLIDWGQTAFDYHEYGVNNPVYEAALDEIVRPVYGGKDAAQTEIESAIQEMLNGAPFDDEAFGEWASIDTFNIT